MKHDTHTLSLRLPSWDSDRSDLFYDLTYKEQTEHTHKQKGVLDGTGLHLSAGGELGEGIWPHEPEHAFRSNEPQQKLLYGQRFETDDPQPELASQVPS